MIKTVFLGGNVYYRAIVVHYPWEMTFCMN